MMKNSEFDIAITEFDKTIKFPKSAFKEDKINVFTLFPYRNPIGLDDKQIDLFNNIIYARWASGDLLADGNNSINNCPLSLLSRTNDNKGAVTLDYNMTLEDGKVYKALKMEPKQIANGTIKGWLPWVKQNGSGTFLAQIGFADGASKSKGVTFQVWVHYRINSTEYSEKVVSQFKKYNHFLQTITADLSKWANQKISIELRVDAGKSSGYNWAVWVNPRIVFNHFLATPPIANLPYRGIGNIFLLQNTYEKVRPFGVKFSRQNNSLKMKKLKNEERILMFIRKYLNKINNYCSLILNSINITSNSFYHSIITNTIK